MVNVITQNSKEKILNKQKNKMWEGIYIRTDCQMAFDSPERIIASTRFFHKRQIIPHEDNDRITCETDVTFEENDMVLYGRRENNERVEIFRSRIKTTGTKEISDAAKTWIENEAQRMSKEYNLRIVRSPIYKNN